MSKFYALDVSDDLSRSGSSCSNEEKEQERLSGLDVSLSSSIDPSLRYSMLQKISEKIDQASFGCLKDHSSTKNF